MFEQYSGNDPFEQAVTDRLLRATELGLREARRLVPVDSGQLKDTIEMTQLIREGDAVLTRIEAGNDSVNYAVHVEYLNKPYLRPALSKIEGEMKRFITG